MSRDAFKHFQKILEELNIHSPGSEIDVIKSVLTLTSNNEICLQLLSQQQLKKNGVAEEGLCYGITKSLVAIVADADEKTDLSKFHTIEDQIKEINDNQLLRDKDQQIIKHNRLTRYMHCPDLSEQAQRLYSCARENPQKHLMVCLDGQVGAHAVYMRMQKMVSCAF